MSALHRIGDIRRMPARRFFTFAERLAAYPGAVRAALASIREQVDRVPPASGSDPHTMTGLAMLDGSPAVQYTQATPVDPPPTPPARLLGA